MTGKNIATIGGLALAAYLLRAHIEQALGIGTTAAPAASSSTAPAASTTPAATTTAPPAGIWPQVQADATKAGAAGMLSPDQWLFYYRDIRGAEDKSPEDLGLIHDRLYTFDEFATAAKAAGLNGLSAAAAIRRPAGRPGAQSFARNAWGY